MVIVSIYIVQIIMEYKKAGDEDDDDWRSFVHIFPLRGYV